MKYVKFESGLILATTMPGAYKDATPMTRADGEKAYRDQILRDIKKTVKPGQTIYTVLHHVSSSGMSRRIGLRTMSKGRLVSLDYAASVLTGFKLADGGGLKVSGCGMDMGFHVVYVLGRAIWPKGTPKPHGMRNGAPDRDGGYALKHEWI